MSYHYQDLIENVVLEQTNEEQNETEENKLLSNKTISIKKNINKEFKGKYYSSVNIKYYVSGDTGTKIIIANTGEKTPYKVGSIYENLFFSSSFENGKNRVKLFYQNPDEYENHNLVLLSEQTKNKWIEKYINYKKIISKLENSKINKINPKIH